MKLKKALLLAVVGGLLAGAMVSTADAAKKKKKPKKPAAVATTLYLHGGSPSGEADAVDWLVNNTLNSMDGTAPTDPAPKSMSFVQGTADQTCTGFPLAWPYWQGGLAGTITGDVKVTLNFVSAPVPGTQIRLWADTPVFLCEDADYIKPAIEHTFDVPAGSNKVEVVVKGVKVKALSQLSMTVWNGELTTAGRVLYDSTGFDSKVEFKCIPASGKSCIPQ